jgi:uncharacterized protein (UPF0261 family)
MRTTVGENAQLGQEIASKVAASTGGAALLFPLRGVSAIDRDGQPFDNPAARQALLQAMRAHHGTVPLIELDLHINDPAFAEAAAQQLLHLLSIRSAQPAATSRQRDARREA